MARQGPSTMGEVEDRGLHFQDSEGEKLIDYVIVSNIAASADHADDRHKRDVFLDNLKEEGIEVESHVFSDNCDVVFYKLHAPDHLLRKYAEILKIKMPIKPAFTNARKLSAEINIEGTDMLEQELTLHEIPEPPSFYEAYILKLEVAQNLKKLLYPDPSIFGVKKHKFAASYSRDQDYLFDDSENFFSSSTRMRVVEFLLNRKRFSDDPEDDFAFGIKKLISQNVFCDAYPLHDGGIGSEGARRKDLYVEWGSFGKWWKFQPLDAIRDYYGVKIALYFAWLGFFTLMLIPPSIVGLITFFYGIDTQSSDIPANDICDGGMGDIVMCPICDKFCDFWHLRDACDMTRYRQYFDNESTVFFSMFMSVWAVVFLELWTRYSAKLTHRWDVYGYDPEEEHPRPEYLAELDQVQERRVNFVTQTSEPKPPFWKMKFPRFVMSWSILGVLVMIAFIAVLGIILYRMSMIVALSTLNYQTIKGYWSLLISFTGAGINLVFILIFNLLYNKIAVWLTDKELQRTQTDYDNALTLKIYLFQFVNFYISIFYIAFFKGQFIGTPNERTRLFGYRQEECSPGGCFMELSIQMAMIFVGKQFFLQIMEYYMPLIWKLYNLVKLGEWKTEDTNIEEKEPQYVMDFKLCQWGHNGLFHEYLEMVIQFGFITIFACAFPLAPLFALINNILEVRLDAKKLLVQYRRPSAQKVKSIGIWYDIMNMLTKIAVVTNAFIIAVTSEFIPKLVYTNNYSPDGTLSGYANFSLSYFDPADMDGGQPTDDNTTTPQYCRYPGYNKPPWDEEKYTRSEEFWHIWCIRLVFVVCFQTVVSVCLMGVRYCIPNVSAKLKDQIRREAYITNELLIKTEKPTSHHGKAKMYASNPNF